MFMNPSIASRIAAYYQAGLSHEARQQEQRRQRAPAPLIRTPKEPAPGSRKRRLRQGTGRG